MNVLSFSRCLLPAAVILLSSCAVAPDQAPGRAAEPLPENWETVQPILPDGFATTIFHPAAGATRHIAVRDNGDVFVARDFRLAAPMFGQDAAWGALLAMRDNDGDGVADQVEEFGPQTTATEVVIHDGWLYFGTDLAVYRIELDDNLVPAGVAEPIAGGFPMQRSHADKTFEIDPEGVLYVNSGVPTNACETKRMTPRAPGFDPCPQLERSGGIWKFDADRKLQDQLRDGERFVTGTRNVLAMEWNPWANKLYFVMHGRDSLGMLWKDFYTREDNAELPAEEFHAAEQGDNFGWPYTYYDHLRNMRMQAPEYGGDGKTEAEGDYKEPLLGFPGHWAPMDMIFHSGKNMPGKYAQGAFIVFHGSWNRMPLEQQGYNVVFVPMRDGKVTGDWEVFADGFTGVDKLMNPGLTAYRPVGIAEGPNGEIYLSEDKHGRMWRVTWSGNP
ncbi:MAG: PQQ-dependent sugar dehydrogenase [Gammaproteobacteria bacterium]|jgi:glucose/arabinose dehydrogenase|nr:PQQ-dependent sugar dehydrogenase [Gammaproteobacteria bacterium]MDP6615973.1 PQQ-dependent sugar dehydrogenase [Gammaproteobacteria bacterium]MDP6694900.1 PQQ-dependent sugar dehydrogenase [Gammaproteobacteria bacterium]